MLHEKSSTRDDGNVQFYLWGCVIINIITDAFSKVETRLMSMRSNKLEESLTFSYIYAGVLWVNGRCRLGIESADPDVLRRSAGSG